MNLNIAMSLIMASLLVVSPVTFAGATYIEELSLEVNRENDRFDFVYQGSSMFEVPNQDILNFRQVALDIADYRRRARKLGPYIQVVLGLTGAAMANLVGGAVVALASLPDLYVPEDNLKLDHLVEIDFDYFTANPNFLSIGPMRKANVDEIARALSIVNDEYKNRFGIQLELEDAILSERFGQIRCGVSGYGVDTGGPHLELLFKAEVVEEVSDKEVRVEFYRSDSNKKIARVNFERKFMSVDTITMFERSYSNAPMKEYSLDEILANIGSLTKSVDKRLIVNEPLLPTVYNWARIYQHCQNKK